LRERHALHVSSRTATADVPVAIYRSRLNTWTQPLRRREAPRSGVSAPGWLDTHRVYLRLSGEIPFGAQDAVGCKSDAFVGRLSTNDGRSTAAPCHPEPDVPITALRDDDRRLVGGKRTSGYWSHRQCGAQIVSNLTSA